MFCTKRYQRGLSKHLHSIEAALCNSPSTEKMTYPHFHVSDGFSVFIREKFLIHHTTVVEDEMGMAIKRKEVDDDTKTEGYLWAHDRADGDDERVSAGAPQRK